MRPIRSPRRGPLATSSSTRQPGTLLIRVRGMWGQAVTDGEYDEFFRDLYPRLVVLGLAMSTPRQVAQELAQETLVRAYRHWDRLQSFDSPYAWCRRVMSNLLIDQHRSRTAERSAVDRLARLSGVDRADLDSDPGPSETRDAWADIVAPLTVRQRCVATLFYAEDLSVVDVADELGISVGSVKSTLDRVRRSHARRLADAAGQEETRA